MCKVKIARVLFARLPILGKTKTRLAYILGDEAALAFYKALLLKQREYFGIFAEAGVKGKNFVFVHPENLYLWRVKKLLRPYFPLKVRFVYQRGFGLGERLFHCVQQLLVKYERVIIWGADIPTLGREHFQRAWESHPKNFLVPTFDGGYALVAISRQNFHEKVFSNILWGGRRVFQEQVRNFERYGLAYEVGERVVDIDYPQDVLRYLVGLGGDERDSLWESFVEFMGGKDFHNKG